MSNTSDNHHLFDIVITTRDAPEEMRGIWVNPERVPTRQGKKTLMEMAAGASAVSAETKARDPDNVWMDPPPVRETTPEQWAQACALVVCDMAVRLKV